MKMDILRVKVDSLLGVVSAIMLLSIAALPVSAEIISPDRVTTWQGNVGVTGDIPARTTICQTLSPSGGDDKSAIQTALNNCSANQVVQLNSGIFSLSGSITIPSNKVLRGAGMGATVLASKSGVSYNSYTGIVDFQNSGTHLSSAIGLASGYTKGSTQIVASSNVSFSVGDIILIDQTNGGLAADPPVSNVGSSGTCSDGRCGRESGARAQGQLNRIAGLSGSGNRTIVLEIPLNFNLLSAQTPQIVKIQTMVNNAGVESLTIDTNLGSPATGLSMWSAHNCWLYRVEVKNTHNLNTRLAYTFRNTIRQCKFHDGGGVPLQPNNGYGMLFQYAAGSNLIEDNIFYQLSTPILMEGETSNNVIAYNFMLAHDSGANRRQNGAVRPHGAHPFMNLFEGNYTTGGWVFDHDWGTMSHNTVYRNNMVFQTPLSTYSGAPWLVQTMVYAHYHNFIGNIMGVQGIGTYEFENATCGWTDKAIYKTGYASEGDSSASGNDPAVKTTMFRHGNWDVVNGSTVWDPIQADRTLPASLYLSGKPQWWGSSPWPSIGPDLNPMAGTIPAKLRYEGGSPPLSLSPEEPTGLRLINP